MDNLKFGAFIARLRKEKNLTQKELADRLHVTDKAVSKWETGKGFPDVKLLEPLAQELGVSLVELLNGELQQSDTMTVEEAGSVAVRAMEQSERAVARKYLKLFRWMLTAVGTWCAWILLPHAWIAWDRLWFDLVRSKQLGVIGGADGPTVIITSTSNSIPPYWMVVGVPMVVLVICVILAIKVRQVEKKLK